MEGDLRSLISERGTFKAALTRFRNFFRDSANTTAIGSLKKRLEANTQLFDNFNKIQTKIEMMVIGTDAEAAHTSEREAFETAYFDLIDEVETHIKKFNVRDRRETPVSPATTSNGIINVRLPTMQLPLFDGNYSDWIKFRDTFTALIHENESLSDVQRFHYLNSSLKGAVARVIQSLGISEANYNLASELLRSRYENSTNLKRYHVNPIIDLKPVHKQTEVALREFIDDITSHRNALRSLGDQIVKEARVCYNCLQSDHRVKACTGSHCKICGKKHHSLLHRDDIHSVKSANSNCNTSTNLESVKTQPLVTRIARESAMCTMLSTAVVYINDHKGQFHKCRVLLDSGSQANFITSEFCKGIGIRTKPIESTVTGLGRALNSIKGKTTVKIHSKFNKYQDSIDCLLIDTITTNMPNFPLTRDRIEIPTHIELADPEFNVSKPIDMLIGASLFWSLLCVGQHKCPSGIIFQKTQLGWVIGGTFTWTDKEPRVTSTCHLATHHDLQSQLEKFWTIEEINPPEIRALDECEAHFRKTTRWTTDGRYIVSIPFKDNIADLGESRRQAERRLYALERKLSKNPQLKQQYVEFLEEYEKLRHMSRVLETPETTAVAYYLPHHAVSKISSTTKVRVVFDGSCTETAPDISKIIMNDFYVDDLLTGAQTSIEISTIKSKLTTILSQAGMHLRKWATNCPGVITMPGSNNNSQETIIERDPKTLGLSWSPRTDELNFMIQLDNNRRTTKRTILSEIARLFDPLGLLGPFIVIAKLILQRLWQIQAGWDESVSQELSTQWLEYREDIQQIQTLKIPRCTIATNLDIDTRLELHGFSDASEKAYGACIYLRSRDTAGQWTAALLCAKSRVAPLKAISLPRLELCGAVLLANLIQKVRIALHSVNPVVHLWTDSTITLTWFRSMPSRWKTFVANRVSEIQTLTSVDSWKHVTSEDNPADMISREVRLSVLAQTKNWWSGPAWLCDDAESWPTPADIQLAPVLEERGESLEFPNIGPLTTTELDDARTRLEHLVQKDAFETEITALRANQSLPRSSPLRSLNPFLDNHGILRVGGRLRNNRLLHAGCQAVIASLHEWYWPLSCKNTVKRILRRCVRCFRVKPTSEGYQMGSLPAPRVTPARPFNTCGTDYAGPFFTNERTRGKVTVKTYICIFVCFVTKAVHIELATNLNTDAFINCFRRFIARRGRCQYIASDNGTNFINARNELAELGALIRSASYNKKIATELSQEGIEWRLIPPHSPHFGGLWEGAIKSAKYHLTRVIGDQRLTFEELYTLLTQVESCLNSRPLSPLSSDPTDLLPLTPGHFLIGTALTALPTRDLRDVRTTRLNRYELIQKMFQHFWQRWQKECIHHMQQRHKWQQNSQNKIDINTLVIIKEDNQPPLQWNLGRVVQLHPGRDGITRMASSLYEGQYPKHKLLARLWHASLQSRF
ncbi:uncharacterized protein LOC116434182 [Nomia melanderi]|uniref:uncharacterized protein LOC116434182 n=1 Tax=Nomia melanderi TaxID=2448451 RepID=UPI003FCED491